MDKNKKEKMKNWLETGIRETDNERLIREKKSMEDLEKRENFIKHGKSMTDLEIINEANLKDITKKLLERLIEFDQIKLTSKDNETAPLIKKYKKLIETTLNEINCENSNLIIDFEEFRNKLDFFNLEFQRINNFKDTNLKETDHERNEREKYFEEIFKEKSRTPSASAQEETEKWYSGEIEMWQHLGDWNDK